MYNNNKQQDASPDRITAAVKDFYEQIQFPGIRPPDRDGLILMRRFMNLASAHDKHNPGKQLRVLDAGCGTGNTVIALARKFKTVEFSGIDLSLASLNRAAAAAAGEQLSNTAFEQWNLLKPLTHKGTFDVVLCLGVLHHTADMGAVLSHLHAVLSGTGELYLWVYGLHGRYRHSLNQRLLAMLFQANPGCGDKTALAREFIFSEKSKSILDDWLGQHAIPEGYENVLDDPTWIADQFLHPEETLLDMTGLIRIITASGFHLEHWLGISSDPAAYFDSAELAARFAQLSRHQRLVALDLLLKPDHYFVVLRKVIK